MAVRTYESIMPKLGKGVFVDPMALVLGDVELGDDTSVWPGAILRGDVNSIRIGARCSIQDGAILHVTHAGPFNETGYPLILGDDITLGHGAKLHGCTLHDRILVGIGAIILDAVVVESDVVIGAGTLVPPGKVLESGFMYMGAPAKKIRPLSDKEKQFFRYSADHYVKLKNRHINSFAQHGLEI